MHTRLMTTETRAGDSPHVHIPPGVQLYGVDREADAQLLLALGAVVRASSQLELACARCSVSSRAGRRPVLLWRAKESAGYST